MIDEIESYFNELKTVTDMTSREDIVKVIQLLSDMRKNGKNIFIVGNGGSASTASHFVCDLNKYASFKEKEKFKAISLVDNIPLITALTNDEGWDNVYSFQLENLMDDGDCIIAISVHGGKGEDNAGLWSQNILKAVKFVKSRRGKVISIVGFDGGILKEISDVSIVIPANSTPQVEGFHLVITHLICSLLRKKI